MAGETDKEDYTDLKFELEHEWQQDIDIRDATRKNEPESQQKSRSDLKKKKSTSPFYRFKIIDEEKKKRRENNNKKA
jgi:hypothetical protein